jgi:hypothetical protein
MPAQGDPELHFWLTRSVGRTLGLNFTDAMHEGRLSADGLARMVATCRTCTEAAACQRWLGGQGRKGWSQHAPEFCAIGRALAALKPH